jgi:glycosyltransferase involved in cell wall biosynthesis
MKPALLKLCKRLGIERNVLLVPEVSETRDALSIMDLFVMPSLKEGLGLALMEAMACGLPVVASGVGGIKSLIQDGCNGLLVRPAQSQELSLAILELLENPDKAGALASAAQSFISQNFSQERMVLQTEEVYRECLDAKYI